MSLTRIKYIRKIVQNIIERFSLQKEEVVSPFTLYEPDPFHLETGNQEDDQMREFHIINTNTGRTTVHVGDQAYIKDANGEEIWRGPRHSHKDIICPSCGKSNADF